MENLVGKAKCIPNFLNKIKILDLEQSYKELLSKNKISASSVEKAVDNLMSTFEKAEVIDGEEER